MSDTPTKRLWHVTLSTDAIILADSLEAAEAIARRHRHEIAKDLDIEDTHLMDHYPAEWDAESIPYGDVDPEDPDRTVGAWIERGAAPIYVATMKRVARAPWPKEPETP